MSCKGSDFILKISVPTFSRGFQSRKDLPGDSNRCKVCQLVSTCLIRDYVYTKDVYV